MKNKTLRELQNKLKELERNTNQTFNILEVRPIRTEIDTNYYPRSQKKIAILFRKIQLIQLRNQK